jgi:hypothetical protein
MISTAAKASIPEIYAQLSGPRFTLVSDTALRPIASRSPTPPVCLREGRQLGSGLDSPLLAKTLGLDVSDTLLVLADEVIE